MAHAETIRCNAVQIGRSPDLQLALAPFRGYRSVTELVRATLHEGDYQVRRSVKYGLYGAVLAGITVATTAAFATPGPTSRTITLVVDGKTSQLSTTAPTVAGALASGRLPRHRPRPGRAGDHRTADERRDHRAAAAGGCCTSSVDGVHGRLDDRADRVAQALSALGYSASDFVSVSRSQRLPLGTTDLELRAPKHVTGRPRRHDAADRHHRRDRRGPPRDLNVHVGRHDRLAPGLRAGDQARPGDRASSACASSTSPSTAPINYTILHKNDSSMYEGNTSVVTAGHEGSRALTYRVVYVDGKRVGKTLVAQRVVSPADDRGRERRYQGAPAPPTPPAARRCPRAAG